MVVEIISTLLLVIAFVGAGIVNALGIFSAQEQMVRWGYPGWWHRLVGGLEILAALLIAMAPTRPAGLLLGSAIVIAAIGTVLRHREPSHLAPLGMFAVLLLISFLD